MNDTILAGLGIAGTIGGTLFGVVLQHQLTRRHSKASRLHDSRIALYADVYTDLHITSRWVDTITRDDRDYSGARPDRAAIGGRMLLLGSPATQRAWQEYEDAERDVWFYIREVGFGGPDERMDPEHYLIVRLTLAVDAMHSAVRAELAQQ